MLTPPTVVHVGICVCPLKGIAAQVKELGSTQHNKGIPPHIKTVGTLLHKNSLPVIVPQTYELGVIAKVKELFPGTFLLFAG